MGYPYRRIDVDSHIQEKPNTWTSRMSKEKWGDRIPHIRQGAERDEWWVDGKPTGYLSTCPAVMPDRVTNPNRWDMIPPSVYVAEERMKAMDSEGTDCQVMYANTTGVSGDRFQGLDPEFEAACVRVYNDYQTEEWVNVNPNRFVALTVPVYYSMEKTLEEVHHNAKNWHRGVMLVGTPHTRGLENYSSPYWEPLWQTVVDLDLVLTVHGSGAAPQSMRIEKHATQEHRRNDAALAASGFSIQPQYFANFLFAGVFDRYPTLTLVAAETGIGWLPWLLESCDYAWEQGQLWNKGLPTRPTDLFKQHCYVDFWYERSAVEHYRHVIGVDRIMWETDFPHPTSLWPNTNEFVAKAFQNVPEEEQYQILVENPKKVFKLN